MKKLTNLYFISLAAAQNCRSDTSRSNCTECIKTNVNCAWAAYSDDSKGKSDCLDTSFNQAKPTGAKLISPRSIQITDKNRLRNDNQLLDKFDKEIEIRPGDSFKLDIEFDVPESMPLDMYFIIDQSGSMREAIGLVQSSIKQINGNFSQLIRGENSNNFNVGIGSFVDKPTTPYQNLIKRDSSKNYQHSFMNHLPLQKTTDMYLENFNSKLDKLKNNLMYNSDHEESVFDAVLQAAACQREINWNDHAKHLITVITDQTAHIMGHGILSGIKIPHDYRCSLAQNNNPYYGYDMYELERDYPSIYDMKKVLRSNNIQTIFSVALTAEKDQKEKDQNQKVSDFYENVVKVLGNGNELLTFESDSEDTVKSSKSAELFVKKLVDAYKRATMYIELQSSDDHSADWNIDIKVKECESKDVNFQKIMKQFSKCKTPKKQSKIVFEVMISLKPGACPESETFVFTSPGNAGNEKVRVKATPMCECKSCHVYYKPNDLYCRNCNGHGKNSCGKCHCDAGFEGDCCQCEVGSNRKQLESQCTRHGDLYSCSGRGNCVCGQCKCSGNYGGKYCECVNKACPAVEMNDGSSLQCNGQGTCSCGVCSCNPGWSGQDCGCSQSSKNCLTRGNTICHGNGKCSCNECTCDEDSIHGKGGPKNEVLWRFSQETRCKQLKVSCSHEKIKDCHMNSAFNWKKGDCVAKMVNEEEWKELTENTGASKQHCKYFY